jgi:hypothetical protein
MYSTKKLDGPCLILDGLSSPADFLLGYSQSPLVSLQHEKSTSSRRNHLVETYDKNISRLFNTQQQNPSVYSNMKQNVQPELVIKKGEIHQFLHFWPQLFNLVRVIAGNQEYGISFLQV